MNGARGIGVGLLACILLAGCATTAGPQVDLEQVQRDAARAYQQQRYELAERDYRLLTEHMPTEAEPWFRLGNIYARTNRPREAARAYHEAVVREPALSRAWYNLAVVRLRQAGHALVELTRHSLPEDPLNARAEQLADGLFRLLGEPRPDTAPQPGPESGP